MKERVVLEHPKQGALKKSEIRAAVRSVMAGSDKPIPSKPAEVVPEVTLSVIDGNVTRAFESLERAEQLTGNLLSVVAKAECDLFGNGPGLMGRAIGKDTENEQGAIPELNKRVVHLGTAMQNHEGDLEDLLNRLQRIFARLG